MATKKPEFNRLLARARLARGLTQKEAARLIGVAQPTFSRWLLDAWDPNNRIPAPKYEKLLASFLEMDADELSRDLDALRREQELRNETNEVMELRGRLAEATAELDRLRRRGGRPSGRKLRPAPGE